MGCGAGNSASNWVEQEGRYLEKRVDKLEKEIKDLKQIIASVAQGRAAELIIPESPD